jgi:hypothetical protein
MIRLRAGNLPDVQRFLFVSLTLKPSAMKKMLFFVFFLFSFSFFLGSCNGKKKTATAIVTAPEVQRDFEKEGYVKANVMYSDMDACKYLLVLANEKRLEPSGGLAVTFQRDQLAVWVKYMPKKDGMSVCMAGQIVDVSDIQLRK